VQGLRSRHVGVYQFEVFLQEHGVRAKGSTQRANVVVARKLLT